MALLGQADSNGFFTVKDYCYPEIPFSQPIPPQVNLNAKRDLFDQAALKSKSREFVMLISGLEFGVPSEVLTTELLLRFMRGELGGPNQ